MMKKSCMILLVLIMLVAVDVSAITGTVLEPKVIWRNDYPTIIRDHITIRNDNNYTIRYEASSSELILANEDGEMQPGELAEINYNYFVFSGKMVDSGISIKFLDDNSGEVVALASTIMIIPDGINYIPLASGMLIIILVVLFYLMLRKKRGERESGKRYNGDFEDSDFGKTMEPG